MFLLFVFENAENAVDISAIHLEFFVLLSKSVFNWLTNQLVSKGARGEPIDNPSVLNNVFAYKEVATCDFLLNKKYVSNIF